MTPDDSLAFVGDPPLSPWRPNADEVHVSVTFTWDIKEGTRLAEAWGQYYPVVKLGGPAINGEPPREFVPGRYVKQGVTFTTRGCNRDCPWCLVPEREGSLRELDPIISGHIIQDNNILQASREHLDRVAQMLRKQRNAAVFSGGLDARRLDDWRIEWLRGLRINSLFLAADTAGMLRPLERAIKRLSFLKRRQLRVYTLLAYNGETIPQAEARLERVWELGGMPFAQLYQPADRRIQYSNAWKALARKWSRPALMKRAHR